MSVSLSVDNIDFSGTTALRVDVVACHDEEWSFSPRTLIIYTFTPFYSLYIM